MRPVTLFTGQWADLSLEQLAPLAQKMGYDGLELACWGDHFDVDTLDAKAIKSKWELLADHGLQCFAVSNHLVGQAVCDLIDDRHQAILSPQVWGDGDPEGVRRRAAKQLIKTARVARRFFDAQPGAVKGRTFAVNGFTGSSIWHSLYAFPPTSAAYWQAGFDDFAKRFGPIMDAFDKLNANFGLEVHPTEIAFDIASAQQALAAIKHHPRFGFNYDPSHLGYQGVDYVKFIRDFADRIFHVHMKDVWWDHGNGDAGVFGGHTSFGDPRRFWDFRSVGRGDINFEEIIVALNDIGYAGPLSIEWEDIRMDREHGATESAAFTRQIDFSPSGVAFDAAFDKENQ
ncbi:sugar phosphate isomerase/epimerase family protein [Synoicihabitans lomoniglobus]|uniref:Sugar phosphate isomerase/epimerase n=1 Tax=Synoicihabitans lomoniglobus TaxID=2909285 RepID=A0AAE9ZZ95_9BACT|nr:sugar phosphate isomerase/epimerase [Opitutaceae bacterium LMO-M01]WED64078.1 sugar phosphate isomerase/epimerase [Opitutaceae bacterium LMO-M01]